MRDALTKHHSLSLQALRSYWLRGSAGRHLSESACKQNFTVARSLWGHLCVSICSVALGSSLLASSQGNLSSLPTGGWSSIQDILRAQRARTSQQHLAPSVEWLRLSASCATLAGASDAVRGAVLSRHVVQLDVNVLAAAEHAAQAWEAAVAARSECTSQQHLAPWFRVCDVKFYISFYIYILP